MINGFSHAIIPNVAFAPVPFFNRAFLLSQGITHTVALSGLEFYYHYEPIIPSPPQTRAIWIRVFNQNNCNVWLRIQENLQLQQKRIEIYTKCELNCLDWKFMPDYYIPEVVNGIVTGQFIDPPIFRHPREINNVASWQIIIDQMRQLLPCACTGNCI